MKLATRMAVLSRFSAGLQGCASPLALIHAVMAYDQTMTEIQSKQLLLSIARAHRRQPLHFTVESNIAASLNIQFDAGATPALIGGSGSLRIKLNDDAENGAMNDVGPIGF